MDFHDGASTGYREAISFKKLANSRRKNLNSKKREKWRILE
jgi:hypothetical protein